MQKPLAPQDPSVAADLLRAHAQAQEHGRDDAHEEEYVHVVVFVKRVVAAEGAPRNKPDQQPEQRRFQQIDQRIGPVGKAGTYIPR